MINSISFGMAKEITLREPTTSEKRTLFENTQKIIGENRNFKTSDSYNILFNQKSFNIEGKNKKTREKDEQAAINLINSIHDVRIKNFKGQLEREEKLKDRNAQLANIEKEAK